jgi:hypothetical protein
MPLTKVQFRPGINRESTSFADQQGWFDSDLIRFRKGRPEKIGGWSRVSAQEDAVAAQIAALQTPVNGSGSPWTP